VSDQGIGMTLDTVRNYFLKAGASLRRSEIWRKTFEDEQGKSRVLRSGRFGIGILAAFLLGNEISLSTRHINEAEYNGIAFTAELDAEAIELKRLKRQVGTTIRVRINSEVKDALLGKWDEKEGKWKNQDKCDWYCLTDPKILLMTDHRSKKLHQKYQLPPFNAKLPPGWHRITHPDYQDIHWTYSKAPDLTCNGIRITPFSSFNLFKNLFSISDEKPSSYPHLKKSFLGIKRPNISIFDFDGNLPLNLQRTSITQDNYSFDNQLFFEILKDFIAYVFAYVPSNTNSNALIKWCSSIGYPGIYTTYKDSQGVFYGFPWFFNNIGISLAADPWHVGCINAKSALFVYIDDISRNFFSDITNTRIGLDPSQAVFLFSGSSTSSSRFPKYNEEFKAYKNAIVKAYNIENLHLISDLKHFFTSGKRILINCNFISEMRGDTNYDPIKILPVSLRALAAVEFKNKSWILLRIGKCPPSSFDFEKYAFENDDQNYSEYPIILVEKYFIKKKPEEEMSLLAQVWKEVVGSPIIPFDMAERRKMKAYEILKPYIEAHEKLKDSV
jgi:hypothetical protein